MALDAIKINTNLDQAFALTRDHQGRTILQLRSRHLGNEILAVINHFITEPPRASDDDEPTRRLTPICPRPRSADTRPILTPVADRAPARFAAPPHAS